jgi:hypothetical protein
MSDHRSPIRSKRKARHVTVAAARLVRVFGLTERLRIGDHRVQLSVWTFSQSERDVPPSDWGGELVLTKPGKA